MLTDSLEVIAIPPVRGEPHVWQPTDTGYYSRAEIRRQTGEYLASIPTEIAAWQPKLNGEFAANLDEAIIALKEYEHYAMQQFGEQHFAVAPFAAILLRTESASSSQIERLTTSARQLALAEIGQTQKSNAQTVLGNVRAMEAALRLSAEINETSILGMHFELLSHQREDEEYAGKFREELVWIGADSAGPLGADYIAPVHERIPALMADLVRFVNRQDLPALLQIAVTHAQFQTIHPFVDGNGRTGRALTQAMLRKSGLLRNITTPLSAGLLRETERYFEALTQYRAGDAGPIVHQFAQAARFAAVSGRQLIDSLAEQIRQAREKLQGLRPQAKAWQILPILIGQPIIDAKYLRTQMGLSEMTAQRALQQLTERGVLVERTGFGRNRVWEHPGVLRVLDAYAADIRRK